MDEDRLDRYKHKQLRYPLSNPTQTLLTYEKHTEDPFGDSHGDTIRKPSGNGANLHH